MRDNPLSNAWKQLQSLKPEDSILSNESTDAALNEKRMLFLYVVWSLTYRLKEGVSK